MSVAGTDPTQSASKAKSIDISIRCHVQLVLSRNQRLEVTYTTHRLRRPGEERLPSIRSEPVKLIVTFCAKNPDDGVRLSIGRGHYRSAPSRVLMHTRLS